MGIGLVPFGLLDCHELLGLMPLDSLVCFGKRFDLSDPFKISNCFVFLDFGHLILDFWCFGFVAPLRALTSFREAVFAVFGAGYCTFPDFLESHSVFL